MPTNVSDNQRRAKSLKKHFGKVQVNITFHYAAVSIRCKTLPIRSCFSKQIKKRNLTNQKKKKSRIKEIKQDKAQRIPLTEYIALVLDKLLKFNLAHKQLK